MDSLRSPPLAALPSLAWPLKSNERLTLSI